MQESQQNARVHTHTNRTLTVLLEDPGDAFVHMLLQFGAVEAEAALKGESKQTASVRDQEASTKHQQAFCSSAIDQTREAAGKERGGWG